jgi:hypothetical protein
MRSRTLRVGIVGVLSAAALVGPGSGGPVAAAQPAAPAQIVASAPYPGHGAASTVVTRNGKVALAYTKAGLTKYDVGAKSVVRRGTTAVKGIEARYSELLVHRDNRIAYVVEEGTRQAVVKVYDITGRAPRLVRTLGLVSLIPEGKKRYFYDAELTSDGRRLLLLGSGFVQVLGLGNPARPTGGVQFPSVPHGNTLAVTPDSRQLVVGYASETEPRLARYLLPRTGAATLETSGPVVAPGWEDRAHRTWVNRVVASPGGGSVLVELNSFLDEDGDTAEVRTVIARVRVDDLGLGASTVPAAAGDQLFLGTVSNDGRRVYLTSGGTTDEAELLPRTALWTDSKTLVARHALSGLGDVRSLSVSPGGPTRGRLFVAAVRNDHHRLLQVDPH